MNISCLCESCSFFMFVSKQMNVWLSHPPLQIHIFCRQVPVHFAESRTVAPFFLDIKKYLITAKQTRKITAERVGVWIRFYSPHPWATVNAPLAATTQIHAAKVTASQWSSQGESGDVELEEVLNPMDDAGESGLARSVGRRPARRCCWRRRR